MNAPWIGISYAVPGYEPKGGNLPYVGGALVSVTIRTEDGYEVTIAGDDVVILTSSGD
jgi:hypothetical protein